MQSVYRPDTVRRHWLGNKLYPRLSALHYRAINALMELEYIIPMGISGVYYEGSRRLKWGSRVCNLHR